ncbi:hypothetical protein H4219_004132 [Mycoemilia scoparia]|uniref:Uncharacterized protein n=1 Tax=Mycoemilia scoparia TaxID=417184 RepID=A0A9W7ZX24_9FUNG|nr:hypothetical protein H4219_004132 [Mycoemilia scoparia]
MKLSVFSLAVAALSSASVFAAPMPEVPLVGGLLKQVPVVGPLLGNLLDGSKALTGASGQDQLNNLIKGSPLSGAHRRNLPIVGDMLDGEIPLFGPLLVDLSPDLNGDSGEASKPLSQDQLVNLFNGIHRRDLDLSQIANGPLNAFFKDIPLIGSLGKRDAVGGLLGGLTGGLLNNILGNGVGPLLGKLSNLPVDVDVTDTIQRLPIVGGLLSSVLTDVLGDFDLDIKAFLKIIATITDPMDPNANLVEQIVGKVNASVYAIILAHLHSHVTKDGRGIVPNLVGPIDVDATATVSATAQI